MQTQTLIQRQMHFTDTDTDTERHRHRYTIQDLMFCRVHLLNQQHLVNVIREIYIHMIREIYIHLIREMLQSCSILCQNLINPHPQDVKLLLRHRLDTLIRDAIWAWRFIVLEVIVYELLELILRDGATESSLRVNFPRILEDS